MLLVLMNKTNYKKNSCRKKFSCSIRIQVARSYQRGENIHIAEQEQYIQHILEVTSMLIVYVFPRYPHLSCSISLPTSQTRIAAATTSN